MLKRIAALSYGVACYLVFFVTFLYAIGFIGNMAVPKAIDGTPEMPFLRALLINVGLLGLFAVQHSVMARRWFKERWTRIVPRPVERSTYVLFSSVALLLMFALWQPMGMVVWHAENATMRAMIMNLYGLGWGLVFVSTLLIDHFDLFGLRQVYLYFRNRPYTGSSFRTPLFYKFVRHPLYLGWLVVFWSAPTMTAAHLLFALATTAYIFLAIQFEERDLVRIHGASYQNYRQNVPMILPVRLGTSVAARFRAAASTGMNTAAGESSLAD
jgi:methanethiol S-methyltransferase